MKKFMLHFLQKDSQIIEVSGNSRLFLNQPEYIYEVCQEYVDVFAVALKQGQPAGTYQHLFRAFQGALLFGLSPWNQDTELGLIVSGKPGSKLLKAPRSRIREYSGSRDDGLQAKTRALVQGWITSLTQGLFQGIVPGNARAMQPGDLSLTSGEKACPDPEYKILWAACQKGQVSLFSKPKWLLPDQGEFFPIIKTAWIESQENSRLKILGPQDYQLLDPDYKCLDIFHNFFLRFLLNKQKISAWQEYQRLIKAGKNDQLSMDSAINQLAEVISRPGQEIPAQATEDNLLTACKLVGQQEGIDVQTPPREALLNTDPLEAIAKGSNFRIRQVALKDRWWTHDCGALVGYRIDPETEEKHPVALLQISPGKYVLKDPGTGKSQQMDKKLNQELDMFAYAFYRPLPSHPLNALDLLRHGIFKSRPDRIMITLMGLGAALLALLTPVATGKIFGTIIPEADRYGLVFIGAVLFSAALATAIFELTKAVAMLRLVARADSALQSGIMDRLLSLATPFFRNYTAGDLAERTMGINAIRQTLSAATIESLLSGVFSGFSLLLLFYYSVQLALVALGLTLVAVIIMAYLGYLQIYYQRQVQHQQGSLSGLILQLITGVAKLRVSGTEDRAFVAWARQFGKMRQSTYQARNIANHLQAFSLVLPVLSILVLFAYIVYTSLINEISVGHIIAFNSAFTQFQTALISMSQALIGSLNVVPLYERLKPILKHVPEVDLDKASPGILSGEIEVNSLYFRYQTDGPPILQDISLQIRAGEFVAVVGGSGGGKSTLLRLLLGFETPESGSIYYDGQDLSGLDVGALRRQLGVVLQNGTIMAGDIFSNIVGSSMLTQDDAWEAARMAGLDKDIQDMPMGMHTMVPAGGGTLSGGQCQRLLIARAIVHKPRIIYFDEATSALDNNTQKIVSQSLQKLNATRVVIAHRLSTIEHADKIFVLDKGSLVQQGTYAELIQQPGVFADLAQRQLA